MGELEHLQRDAVIDYLQMPERVKNVELQVGALRGELSKLTLTLARLGNLENAEESAESRSHAGKDYVF